MLKSELNKEFEMKDLGAATIIRDRKKMVLKMSQEMYVCKLLKKFGINQAKSIVTPLSSQFRLSVDLSPSSKEDADYMSGTCVARLTGI